MGMELVMVGALLVAAAGLCVYAPYPSKREDKEIVKRRLERRCQEAPQVQRAIEKALAQINGRAGDPRSFDKLDELLNAQSYRLAFWRVAAEEINYRRFFDVNDLAAIRMELPEVFEAAHQLILELVRSGAVTGLRIDHPDGLYLPKEYLETLRKYWIKNGITVPFYTADGPTAFMLEAGNIDGAAIGLDSGSSEADFGQAKKNFLISPPHEKFLHPRL